MSLRAEILEQPEVAARFLERAPLIVGPLAEAIRARDVEHVVIAARGTSDHAAIYAQYVLGIRHALSVGLGTPSVISLYGAEPRLDRSLVIGISQSGASPDVVGVIEAGRRQGAPTLAITNDPRSPLALAAETTIDLGAGPELAIAATKTYTTELLAIASLSVALSGDPADAAALSAMPDAMKKGDQPPIGPVLVAAHELLDQLYEETERLLREKEPAIHHLAEALIARDELIGDELEEVFAEVEAAHPELLTKFERRLIQFREFAPLPFGPETWAPPPTTPEEAEQPAASIERPAWQPPREEAARSGVPGTGPGMPPRPGMSPDSIPPWATR